MVVGAQCRGAVVREHPLKELPIHAPVLYEPLASGRVD